MPALTYLGISQNPLSNDTVLNQIPKLKETIRTIEFPPQSFLAPIIGDVNGDQIVNIFDLVIVASNFGQNEIVAAPFISATIQLNRKQKYNIRQAIYQLKNKTHKPTDQQLTLNLLKTILS